MVDFQSRDTSRSLGDDDEATEEADEPEGETAPADDTDSEPADTDSAREDSERTDSARGQAEIDEEGEADPLGPATTGKPAGPDGQPGAGDGATEGAQSAGGAEPVEHDFEEGSVRDQAEEQGPEPDQGVTQTHDHDHAQPEDQDHDHAHHDDHDDAHHDDHAHDHDDAHHDDGHGHDHDHAQGHDHDHAHGHEDVGQLGVAVVTVSSTRKRENDPSGDAIVASVEEADHDVVMRDLVVDDLDGIQRGVLSLTGRDDVDVVVTTGGTGVTPDDVTVEAVKPLFDKTLPGFGELFRILSYEEVGTRAVGSRATAGVSEGVPVFCLPGSEAAVRLGMEELVVEEMAHLVGLATRSN